MRVNPWKLAAQIGALAVLVAAVLFWPAGTIAWSAGWVFFALFTGFVIAISLWLLRHDPGLLVERMEGVGQADQSPWDKLLLSVIGVLFFAWLAFMALDAARFHWSQVPIWVQWVGTLLLITSFYLFYRTYRENTFLSPAVRIQTERAQTVVSSGPYRLVRHPMYSAFALLAAGTPLLLGSWYGLLGTAALVGLIARRAVLEERDLVVELKGYREYRAKVRYRLIPYLW